MMSELRKYLDSMDERNDRSVTDRVLDKGDVPLDDDITIIEALEWLLVHLFATRALCRAASRGKWCRMIVWMGLSNSYGDACEAALFSMST